MMLQCPRPGCLFPWLLAPLLVLPQPPLPDPLWGWGPVCSSLLFPRELVTLTIEGW